MTNDDDECYIVVSFAGVSNVGRDVAIALKILIFKGLAISAARYDE
jgi:hypothetical protein